MARLLAARHRRGSKLYWTTKRRLANLADARHRKRERRQLQEDLTRWQELGARCSAISSASEEKGLTWKQQAIAQGREIDEEGVKLNEQCAEYIAENSLQRGQPPWTRSIPLTFPVATWSEYERAAEMPQDAMLRTVASDSLSFPLTAAHACRLAGVRADRSGHLSLLILGAEASELSCVEKWSELLHRSFGLSATTLYLLFVGPRVPKRLDGTFHYYPEGDQSDDDDDATHDRGGLHVSYLRGLWHECQDRVPTEFVPPDLALAFNSGLADYASSWLPTLEHLYFVMGVPLAFTSYHQPEAELDARTLAVRLLRCKGQRKMKCMPNPFASRLPHLDYLFVGQVYVANAFLSVICR